jgi:hypothetical protein
MLTEHTKRTVKSSLDFSIGPSGFGRIWGTPMEFPWFAREQGTAFTGGLIAHRDHQIKRFVRKLVPRLTARLPGINTMPRQGRQSLRMNGSGGQASCAPGPIPAMTEMIDQRFRHD